MRIKIGDKLEFVGFIEGDKTPEIYGWVENDYSMVKGSSGWYRTTDFNAAAAIAKSNQDSAQ